MSLGPSEILLVLLVALIVLGPDQLPKAARQLGRAVGEFKKFSANMQAQVNEMVNADVDDADAGSPDKNVIEPANPANPDVKGFAFIDESLQETSAPPATGPVEAREIDRDYSQTGTGPGTLNALGGETAPSEEDSSDEPSNKNPLLPSDPSD